MWAPRQSWGVAVLFGLVRRWHITSIGEGGARWEIRKPHRVGTCSNNPVCTIGYELQIVEHLGKRVPLHMADICSDGVRILQLELGCAWSMPVQLRILVSPVAILGSQPCDAILKQVVALRCNHADVCDGHAVHADVDIHDDHTYSDSYDPMHGPYEHDT